MASKSRLTQANIKLDSSLAVPLARQLYEEMRRLIVRGELVSGAQLPSSRQLAQQLGLARGTVIVAYEKLKSDGYFEAKGGSGTRVKRDLPRVVPQAVELVIPRQKMRKQLNEARLSSFARRLMSTQMLAPYPEPEIAFYFWRPDLEAVPIRQLLALLARQTKAFDSRLYDYPSDPLGYRPLRESIARYLHRARGVKCDASQIAIMNGWKHSLDLTARLHIERGDLVAVENPCYRAIRNTFSFQGGVVYPVPVDANGIDVDALMSVSDEPLRMLYVSPSHQLPLGSVLSLPRRIELLSWAARTGTLIFEDEHDSEYCHTGSPIMPLKAMDENDQIILQGTFHKVLFPGLSVSYLVLPEHLIEVYAHALAELSEPVPTILQAALADFMRTGYLQRHMRKMRALYSSRRTTLIKALRDHFGESLKMSGESSGMHLVVRFQCRLSDEELINQALAAGVAIPSTRDYYVGLPQSGEFMLGYACLTEQKIVEGVRRLAKIIHDNS